MKENWHSLIQQTNFGIKEYDDCLYFGELKGKHKHGKGVLLYKANRVYEGEFENDLRQGLGFE